MASPFKKTKLCPPTKSHSYHSESKENIPTRRKLSDSVINPSLIRASNFPRPLQVLAEVSSNTSPIQIEPTQVLVQTQTKSQQPCTSKSSTQPSTRSKDFCCIYQTSDKRYSIIKAIYVKVPNVESIMIGKTYEILIGKNAVKGLVKFLGTKLECINQVKNLETYCGPGAKSVSKRKTISTDSIKSINENVSQKTEETNKRIKELEQQIKEKDIIIEQLKEEIKIKRDIIDFYKHNFDNDKVRSIRTFCSDFIKLFGSSEDLKKLEEIQQIEEKTEYLSPDYKHITVSRKLKRQFDEIIKMSNKGGVAFRKIVMRVIPDIAFWAKESLNSVIENHGDTIHACYDYVHESFDDFTFAMVQTIVSRITTESRNKLQKQGYTVVTTYDPICKRPVFELIKDDDGDDDEEEDEEFVFESEEQRDEFNEVFGHTNLEDVLLNPFGEIIDFKQECAENNQGQYEDV